MATQTPEQKAHDNIDAMLKQAGWKVQPKKKSDFTAGPGIAVREYIPMSVLRTMSCS